MDWNGLKQIQLVHSTSAFRPIYGFANDLTTAYWITTYHGRGCTHNSLAWYGNQNSNNLSLNHVGVPTVKVIYGEDWSVVL